MNIDEAGFRDRLTATFRPLTNIPSGRFPQAEALAVALRKINLRPGTTSTSVTPELASYFGTAAVEIWLRSVHSFLISLSLTEASPIWASVSGYYSSHYSVRGAAHLLGYFYLFNGRKIVRLEIGPRGGYLCSFPQKPKGVALGGEHQLYWSLVKGDPVFSTDPFFTDNKQDIDESDAAHRNFANYVDHIHKYPVFHPLDKALIKTRIDQISKIVLTAVPIPRRSKFPDVEYVQLIAYHRMVSFRKILDEVLGHSNRFWNVHRNPSFATGFIDFQIAQGGSLAQPTN